jgi:hypothetical protein
MTFFPSQPWLAHWWESWGSLHYFSPPLLLIVQFPKLDNCRWLSVWEQLWGILPQTTTGNTIRGDSKCPLSHEGRHNTAFIDSLICLSLKFQRNNKYIYKSIQRVVCRKPKAFHVLHTRHTHPGIFLSVFFYSSRNISNENFQDIKKSYE